MRLSLLTYPVLMAADILAYGTDDVPVGNDQTQHVELARDLAVRFNQRYGHTFVVPRATNPAVAARVMNLQEPASKMGKSDDVGPGIVYLLDEPDVVRKKVMRGRDRQRTRGRVRPGGAAGAQRICWRFSPPARAGEPAELAGGYDSYGALKKDTAEAVVEYCGRCGGGTRSCARTPGMWRVCSGRGRRRPRRWLGRPWMPLTGRSGCCLP